MTSRLAGLLPQTAVARVVGLTYRRAEPELGRLAELCGTGGVMIDVGAWYGPWSLRLAKRADHLITIEPTARHEVLRKILPASAEVIHAAASDQAGTGELWTVGTGNGTGGGTEGMSSMRRREIHGASISVPLIKIDDLDAKDVRFIKIDVEGHELNVLRGAEETVLRERPRLLVEVEERIQPVEPLIGLVTGWGYTGWVLSRRSWRRLEDIDLVGRQAATVRVANRGMMKRLIWPYPRYLNSVLFIPAEQGQPGAHTAARR
ncbi:MAG TPA: FkbM family methyltransferase [Streptosporangiaceae bacterium]|nr:FkbM family methyltransferase [Streptosporangiaceae bacterium]